METLKGKQVLVVGATGTIGAAIVKLLIGSGANVAITGRESSKLADLATSVGISQERCFLMDLSNTASIQAAMASLKQVMPVVDIMVNAAGIGIIKPLEMLSENDFMQSLQVNLIGVFHLMQAILPSMKEQKKGLIINIPGVLGKVPMAGAAAYSASKYGLVGMMQSIREELKRTEIRITNLFLGGVDSAFWDQIDLRVQRDKMVVADEAAKAVWFLCQQPRSGVVSEMVLQPFNHQAI
ncbi:MAG: oxidoreductase [Chitinophagaceae bacterium BSSC1]|nr:MAG: oxidoreductase [Chitinophagaceae bacterium BSSC1]